MEKKIAMIEERVKEGRETPGDILRPIRRRSSILPRANSDPLEINDDSVERGRTRHETPSTSSSSSRRSLNLGSINQLSSPQIAAGVAECIKLNTENKITKKNAFSLKLIDLMTYMVNSKDEKMSNLQMASTTLDVSAKIYGLRVDVLHQETMDMVGNLEHENNENQEGNVEENGQPFQENPVKAKKKKKKRSQVLTDVESLCCELEIIKLEPPMLGDGDFQTSDMLLQVNAPRHVGMGLSIHPYNDYILDSRKPEIEEANEKIPYNPIKIPEDSNIGKIFNDFEFSFHLDSEYDVEAIMENWSQRASVSQAEPLSFDPNASFPEEDEDDHDDVFINDELEKFDEEEAVPVALHHRQREAIVNADDMIAAIATVSDYSFFDENLLEIKWRSGTQWTVKRPRNMATSLVEGDRRAPLRKKKDFSIDFMVELDPGIDDKFVMMKKVKRKFKNLDHHLVRSEENFEDQFGLFKFGLRPDDVDLMPNKRVGPRGQAEVDNERRPSVNSDDYHDNDYDGGDMDHDNSLEDQPVDLPVSQGGNNLDEFASQGGFTGSNLIEAPKLTEKIYIPFSQRAKKIDMRHLKKCIWNSISSGNDDKENVEQEEGNGNTKQGGEPKTFAEIYEHLPDKLSKNDAKELSFPIAFVSLLHLANEKNLKLLSTDNLSDIIVHQHSAS
ncbi:condensin complex subunit 2 [Fopius arisanus]|uniref:Condensin complex subunit 2 n=1 Tax=Fopius arisanus TaxID=64838 RepID=A0A0C9RRA3_9HYME|nr:PREDICTED: condensin complex subunit 2 [Fopius arisanus]